MTGWDSRAVEGLLDSSTAVQVRREVHIGRWWPRTRIETRRVPSDYLPFAAAYLAGHYARANLRDVAPLLHLPAARVDTQIESALWDLAGSVLEYLRYRREARTIRLEAEPLNPGHPLYASAQAASDSINEYARILDTQLTEACDRVEQVCQGITDLHNLIRAEDRTREALRRADRRGAYSSAAPELVRPTDLSDRVEGLTAGLREMATA